MKHTACVLLLLLLPALTACGSTPRVAESRQLDTYSDAPWQRVLAGTVRDGMVDYRALAAQHEQGLAVYLDAVARFGPTATPERFPTREHELAYYLNAYNALMLERWRRAGAAKAPVGRDVNVLWFVSDFWQVDGRTMSMDTLEQSVIRPEYDEPRIHFALVCGAVSCPPLLGEPFVAERLDQQLESLGRRWFEQDDSVRVDADGTVRMSKIFEWYRDDFDSMGGLAGVIERYLPESDPRYAPAIEAARGGDLAFMGYDWSINTVRAAE